MFFDIANTLTFVYLLFETFHFVIFESDKSPHSSTLHNNISYDRLFNPQNIEFIHSVNSVNFHSYSARITHRCLTEIYR